MSKRRFRLYLDFAAGGSMTDALTEHHGKWVQTNGKGRQWAVDNTEIRPEAFMRKAQASSPDAAEASPSKRPKANNAPTKSADKTITLLLADFGIAFFDLEFPHCPSLSENPHEHVFEEATGLTRYPPELINPDAAAPVRLGAATDIWGLDRIAWSLVVDTLELHGPVREFGNPDVMIPFSANGYPNRERDDGYKEQVIVGSQMWLAAGKYGEELKDLVRRCLKWEKVERSSAREVSGQADAWLAANQQQALAAMDVGQGWLDLPDSTGFEVGDVLVARV